MPLYYDLENDNSTNLCDNLIENDSVPTIKIFELFKQTVFIDADENCGDGDDKEVGGQGVGGGRVGGGEMDPID